MAKRNVRTGWKRARKAVIIRICCRCGTNMAKGHWSWPT